MKKRWDKEDPEEIKRRRKEKAIARGEHWSDSVDNETEGDGEDHSENFNSVFGGNKGDGSTGDILGVSGGKDGKSMMDAVTAARNKALSGGLKEG